MLQEELPSFSDLSLKVCPGVCSACLNEGEEQKSTLSNKMHGYLSSSLFFFDSKKL